MEPTEEQAFARFVSSWTGTRTRRPNPAWSAVGIPFRIASTICPPASSNVMLHAGRCGSTVLNRLLNQHPRVHFEGEILGARYDYHFGRDSATIEIQDYDVGSGVRRRWWRSRRNHYGMEVKTIDLPVHGCRTLQDARDLLKSCGSRLMVLRRRNGLRRFLSAVRPELTGSPWHRRTSPDSDASRMRIDLDRPWASRYPDKDIEGILRQEDDAVVVLGALARDADLDLWFEDHVRDDPTVGYRAICETIGIEPVPVTTTIRRTNPGPISSIVENVDELRERLEGSRWAWMLDAD
ncbi:MAG: hypothetical protein VX672_02180 [Planctomycetota bacterium]|nr:hypothetical protein [Planctomycetota bacterium]